MSYAGRFAPTLISRACLRALAGTLIGGCSFLLAAAPAAAAYPEKAIRIVSAHAAGGGADTVARTISGPLARRLGQTVIVENRPGASTMIGAEYVAQQPADGYTLLLATVTTLSINPLFYPNIRYNVEKDFAPVANLVSTPFFLGVTAGLPAKDAAEFVELVKSKPGALSYGSSGTGTSSHLAGELFNQMAGLQMLHVPYKATSTRGTELMAGVINAAFANDLQAHAQSGKVRLLGVTSAKRLEAFPDVPTVAESANMPGYEASVWYGLVAPGGTPPDIVKKLNTELVAVLAEPEVRKTLTEILSGEVVGNTPEEFAAQIKSDAEKWAEVVKRAGIKLQ